MEAIIRLIEGESLAVEVLGVGQLICLGEQLRLEVERGTKFEDGPAGFLLHILQNVDHALHERQRIGAPIPNFEELRKVLEIAGHDRVHSAKAGLIDGQSAVEQGLGLGRSIGIPQDLREVVEHGCHGGVLSAQDAFVEF